MYPMYFFGATFFCGLYLTLRLRSKDVVSFHTASIMIGLYGCKFAVLLGQDLAPLSVMSCVVLLPSSAPFCPLALDARSCQNTSPSSRPCS